MLLQYCLFPRGGVGVFIPVQDYCEFLYVGFLISLEFLPVFNVCLCGNFVGSYLGTVVLGYGDIVIVCDMLGLVSLTVGLMRQVQHVDVWIFKSRT
jgi:hypothetical protein